MNPAPPPATPPSPLPRWLVPALSRPWIHFLMGAGILTLDYLTGPLLTFPILFIIPVALSAWFYTPRCGFALAILLPLGRFFLAEYVEHTMPTMLAAANCAIRMFVLLFLAYLVGRTSRQTRELQNKLNVLEGILPICMFCKRIRDERETWQPIERYISQRSEADFSHGMCPDCARKHYADVFPTKGGA